ncbi:sugar ABC transporter substrate-binding protein [Bacillus timonensis]|uniref:Sugar ABC transporter substrate-binding protein n=1 Tax=Bacillus timonensis TaxID=1033734 RepID=A0A4S3PQQ4_9BACI|nr:sugar ABC transporter substrate-binding protein [Bacillus timonensis]THE11848.1 sugar ABC transporter substrate-binding protein [Bacillus timonensis]
MFKTLSLNHKLFLLVFTVLIFGGLITGCSSKSGSSSENEGGKSNVTVIKIGVESGSLYANWYKEIAPQFIEKTGIEVEFIDIPLDNMHTRFLTEAASGTGAIDIFTTDQPWISEFAEKGFLEPLDDMLAEEDIEDFIPSALETVQYNDKIYALPYLVHTPVLYYRTDLFEEAGLSGVPETLEEFREYAKELNDPTNEVFGTVVEGKQATEPTIHLMDYFLQFGGGLMEGDEVIIDSPENREALNYMLTLQHEDESSPKGAVSYDNADVHNLFLQGKVAMAINWPYMYSMANDPSQSKVAGKFEVAALPKGKKQASAALSWGFGISSSSKNKEAAIEWLKWSTSKEIMVEFGKEFINPISRNSAIEELNRDESLEEEDRKAIETMSKAVEFGQNVTTHPKFPQIQQRLMFTLSRVMTQQSTPEEELELTDADVQDIVND